MVFLAAVWGTHCFLPFSSSYLPRDFLIRSTFRWRPSCLCYLFAHDHLMGFNGDGVPVRLKTLSFCVRTRARVCVCVCVCTRTHSTLHFIRPLRISAQRVTLILPSCFPAEELKWRGTTDLIISLITVTLTLPEKQHRGNKGLFSTNFICGNLPFIGWRQCHVIRDYQLIG